MGQLLGESEAVWPCVLYIIRQPYDRILVDTGQWLYVPSF